MLSDELRRRISLLNRAALRQDSRPAPADGPPLRLPFAESITAAWPPRGRLAQGSLEGREVAVGVSRYLLMEKRLTALHHSAQPLLERFHGCFVRGQRTVVLDDPLREELAGYLPHRWLFLDIETCGFANSPIFLVGVLQYLGDDFRLRQFLARDYSEEAAMLAALAQLGADFDALITFNGKTFDWPCLLDRSAVHRVEMPSPRLHFDLLHASRRQWKTQFPNCRLQTLERFICRRVRRGDIPGFEIPAAYHEYVRTGTTRRMLDILHHNALDLVTMSEVILNLFDDREADWP